MSDEPREAQGHDRRSRVKAIEKRLAEHPAYQAHMNCEALYRTLTAVFFPNCAELLALLERASRDENLAVELIQNVRAPVIRERFQAQVSQRLHNYLAATATLVDHSRRILRGRSDDLASAYKARKTELLKHADVPFVIELRNFTVHRVLPFVGHTLTVNAPGSSQQTAVSEVALGVDELRQWGKWSASSIEVLDEAGDSLLLRPLVRRHSQLVGSFNAWLHDEIARSHESALGELNQLVVERNAALAGVDLETARQITKNWTESRSSDSPTIGPLAANHQEPPKRASSDDPENPFQWL